MNDPINNTDTFIEWHGGECPVRPNELVEYKTVMLGDKILKAYASILNWHKFGFQGAEYITHYRIART